VKLIYSIPDKLYYIQNFLDFPTYKKIHYDVFRSKLVSLKSTKEEWDEGLQYGHKGFVDRTGIKTDYIPLQKIITLLEHNPFHKVKIKNVASTIHTLIHSMKDGAGINWHDDGRYSYGITYYINRRWNKKFGGEFLFMDKNTNGFIPLVANSLVIVKAPFKHKVSPVQKPIVPRKTIQIFVDK